MVGDSNGGGWMVECWSEGGHFEVVAFLRIRAQHGRLVFEGVKD